MGFPLCFQTQRARASDVRSNKLPVYYKIRYRAQDATFTVTVLLELVHFCNIVRTTEFNEWGHARSERRSSATHHKRRN
jgi:hypothetical protein